MRKIVALSLVALALGIAAVAMGGFSWDEGKAVAPAPATQFGW